MLVCKLQGGLGNQFFEYATGYALAKSRNCKMLLDISSFNVNKLRKFELGDYSITSSTISECMSAFLEKKMSLYNKLHIGEKYRTGIEKVSHVYQDLSNARYLSGYYQHLDYFNNVRDELLREFTYDKDVLSDEERRFINEWTEYINNNESVMIHVRRTDYLKHKDVYNILDESYYEASMRYIEEIIDNPVYIVFSDDIEWCKNQDIFNKRENIKIVDSNEFNNPSIDMELMRVCKYFIIANSTYSWWGAYLSEKSRKVLIAPKNWFVSDTRNKNIQDALLKDYIIV